MAGSRYHIPLIVGLVLGLSGAEAGVQFVDVSDACGIGLYTMPVGHGSGVAAADFDDDGDVDFFVPNAEGVADQLYRNLGNGEFEEIAAVAGVASLMRSRVALWLDYDDDHRLDLVVAGDCWEETFECADTPTVRVYRQTANAQFDDVSLAAGFADDLVNHAGYNRGGMAAGDLDGDGDLDLVFGLWIGPLRLMLNQGDGTFSDATPGSGMQGLHKGHWQPMLYDFDGDRLPDIYFAIDFTENYLWMNQGNAYFINGAAQAGVAIPWNDMGMALGDYDNDGDFDIYITNAEVNEQHNTLLRNDSDDEGLQFTEVAQTAGVDHGGWGWGTTIFDADNDGWLDIAATNGWWSSWPQDPSKFFLNLGGDPVTFADASDASGFNDVEWGGTLLSLDYDRDGDLDLLQTVQGATGEEPHSVRLFASQLDGVSAAHHYLVIQPRMPGTNHRAIGAVVRAKVGGLEMARLITAGTSYLGQEPAEAFFGLGAASSVDEVTVEWPGGAVSVHADIDADEVLTIFPPIELTVGDGSLDWVQAGAGPSVAYDVVQGDLGPLLAAGGDFGAATTVCLADDVFATTVGAAAVPSAGEAYWYLVRDVSPGGNGSYDEQSGSQIGSRDAGIDAAPQGCP